MLHPRDRYRKDTSNTCLEIWVALIATVIVILLGVCLYLAIHQRSSVSDDTKKITSQKTIRLTDVMSNNTITPVQVSLKKAQILNKENVTIPKVVIETSSNQNSHELVPIKLIAISHNSLARKGRYMRRALLKNKKSKYSNSD